MISIWHQIVNKLGVRAPQNNKDLNFINQGVLYLSLNRWLSYRTDKLVTDRQVDRHTHHAGNDNTQRPKLTLSKNCIFKYRSPRGQWVNFHLPDICPHPPWGRLHHCISQKTVRIQEQCVDMDHTYKISKCTWYHINLARNGNSECANEILGCAKMPLLMKIPMKMKELRWF